MRWGERWAAWAALAVVLTSTGAAVAQEEPLLRHRAPITVERSGAFVAMPLPASAYAKSAHPDLRDLRVVDARGERVPFALLAPRPEETEIGEQLHQVQLYALPPRKARDGEWTSPVDVTVDGERIAVRRRGGPPTPPASSPGWLIDLGERDADEPPPQSLRLQWSAPTEFSVGYTLEQSDDLRQWRPAGSGQVMALASAGGALTQPIVPLGAAPARFLRLVWSDRTQAPRLTGAQAVTPTRRSVTVDEPTELVLPTSAAPAGGQPADDDARRALHYDLGAPLPIVRIDLRLPNGTQVVPARIQVRDSADRPWQPLTGGVFYRIDRGSEVTTSPAIAVRRTARFVRIVPDARAATPDPATTRLVVRVQLSSIVFAAQGEPPYALLAGAAQATPGALPLATLVPSPDDERPRFGQATLGAWSEVEAAVRQAEAEQRRAALRPWLLWAVLVLGVAGLGFLVWRLARQRPAD